MSDDSEPEIDPATILAAIEGKSRDDARQPSDEGMDTVRTITGDVQAILASDETDLPPVDGVLAGLTGRQSEFLTQQAYNDLSHRHAPYSAEYATWLRLDFADGDEKTCWPFAFGEDKEGESNE